VEKRVRAAFDLERSRVTRQGDRVELLLADPRWEDVRAATYLQFTQDGKSVRGVLIAEQGNDIALARCRVPDTKLIGGRWQLSVQTVAGPRPIGADLVVRGAALKLTANGPSPAERLVAAGSKAVNVLPPGIRGKVRKIARTALR
jgi:hypothetical protein